MANSVPPRSWLPRELNQLHYIVLTMGYYGGWWRMENQIVDIIYNLDHGRFFGLPRIIDLGRWHGSDWDYEQWNPDGSGMAPALGQEQPIFKISERRKCTKYRKYILQSIGVGFCFILFTSSPYIGIRHENHSGSRCQVRALCRPFLCSWLKLLVEHPSCAGGRSENIVRPVPLLR